VMNSKELIEQAKEEIAMFHRPARATSCLMMEMVESQAVKIAELEKTVKSLTDAVSLFRQDNYDTQPLIIAYKEALKEN
jgi:hypothetical protein